MTEISNKMLSKSENNEIESQILQIARESPEMGQAAVARRLRTRGYQISASGVRYIWQKHGLETTVKRLRVLAEQTEGGIDALSEKQQQLLARGNLTASLAESSTQPEEEPLDRRRVILNVASELFSERGYAHTSIRDIAGSAGLLPGSVYHHFPSKEDLYLAIHREGFRRVMAKVKAAAAEGTDPWDRLRRACEVHVYGMLEGSPVDRITGHGLALTGDKELFEKVKGDRMAYERQFRELIDALPLKPEVDRSLLRLTLLGALNWVVIWYQQGKRSPYEIADAMVSMIRNGVQDSSAEF